MKSDKLGASTRVRHIGRKRVKAVTRLFLDWGGLNAADAEATVLADVLRSKGIVGKLGSEGVLAKIANKISPSKGVSRLCP
jgi:hypothetical protein